MPNKSQRIVLTVLTLAAFMAALDVFIVNVAFTAIGADFGGTSLSALSWVLNAYAILYAALLVPAGRLADRYGRKEGFLLGLAIFTVASASCAATGDVWWLVGFRALQALGAALLTPASLGLLIAAAPPERRARWVRIWAGGGALAAALGPAVGGVLVEASWRWVFLVNVPIGLGTMLAAVLWVPASRDHTATRIPDLLGSALLAVAIGALALGIVEGPTWGWAAGRTDAAWLLTAGALAAFVFRSAHHPAPVVDPALLRIRPFTWANVTAVLFSAPFAAALLVDVLWMQNVWHYSAIRTGLAVVPGPALVPIFAAYSHRLAAKVPVGLIVALGCALVALGTALVLVSVEPTPAYASAFLPGWMIGGAGVGLAMPNILSAAAADLPANRSATGSAIVTMSRQIGMVLGVSLVVAVLGATSGHAVTQAAFRHTWAAIVAVALLAALAAPRMSPARRRAAVAVPAAEPAARPVPIAI